jgi:hypothetical protein
LYFGNLTAYFAAKAGVCIKPSVEILATISINFVPFLAILFVTFEYYRNLAPDCQVKKTLHLTPSLVPIFVNIILVSILTWITSQIVKSSFQVGL